MIFLELVRRNIDKIPKSYNKYGKLLKFLDMKVNKNNTHNTHYICDMGAEGSVIVNKGEINYENIEYTERVDLNYLITLEVDLDSYDYIYQLGVQHPNELQILNAILHFDKSEFC